MWFHRLRGHKYAQKLLRIRQVDFSEKPEGKSRFSFYVFYNQVFYLKWNAYKLECYFQLLTEINSIFFSDLISTNFSVTALFLVLQITNAGKTILTEESK